MSRQQHTGRQRQQQQHYKHLHCFDLSLPTNIYSMCVLHDKDFDYNLDEINFVFVATSNCLFCIQQTTSVSASMLLPELFKSSSVADTTTSTNTPLTPNSGGDDDSILNSPAASSYNSGRKVQWDASPDSTISNLQIHELPIHNTRIPADTDIISVSAFRKKRNLKKSTSNISLSSTTSSGGSTTSSTSGTSNISSSTGSTGISKSKSLTNLTMDASSASHTDDLIVVAVTFAQFLGEDVPPQCFLYLYKFTERELLLYSNPANSPTVSPLITNIGSNSFEDSNFIRSFSLNFVPLQLMRRSISNEGNLETMFLLSGSDKKVHCFLPDTRYNWVKLDVPKYKMELIPNLVNLQGSAICIDIYDGENYQVTAIGCQNGFLQLYIKSNTSGQYIDIPPLFLNGPVNSVKLFRCRSDPTLLNNRCKNSLVAKVGELLHSKIQSSEQDEALNGLNLVVGETIGRVTLFRNVEKLIFNDPIVILSENPRHGYQSADLMSFDSILCTHVSDVNADGLNEILIGTYSKHLLIYCPVITSDNNITYELSEQYKFPAPIYSIKTLDINKDGLEELFICSMYHVHVMQPDLVKAKQQVNDRVTALLSIINNSRKDDKEDTEEQ
jgi:hypothetical protein